MFLYCFDNRLTDFTNLFSPSNVRDNYKVTLDYLLKEICIWGKFYQKLGLIKPIR